MIETLLLGLFPCAVQIDLSAAEPWRREIIAAVGVYSRLSGTMFTEGSGGIRFVVDPHLTDVDGEYAWGTWQGSTVTLAPAALLTHRQRLHVTLHELGHAYWMGHSRVPSSVMNPDTWQSRLGPTDISFITAGGCRNY